MISYIRYDEKGHGPKYFPPILSNTFNGTLYLKLLALDFGL